VEVDAQKYLDKFLKYNFALPDKVVARFEEERALVSAEYFKQLIRSNGIAGKLKGLIEQEIIMDFIRDMIERNGLSLRETERLVRFLEIYYSLGRGGLDSQKMWQYILLRITGVFIFCFYPNLMNDINKNYTHSKDFARLFNIPSLSNIPLNSSGVIYTNTNVIAMMFILHGQKDVHFNFSNVIDLNRWQKLINEKFLENEDIYPGGISGVLSILKDTFRVLSLE
jgi:P-loop domain protein, KAP family